MTAILGAFDLSGGLVDVALVRAMAARQRWRGDSAIDIAENPSGMLAVSRFDWEFDAGHCGDVLALQDDFATVVVDGCLFYREALRDRLKARGVLPGGTTTSHYILAAYRAWGDRCAEHLEGNFSFIIQDRRTGSIFCARDFAGSRPLFFGRFGDTLIIASTVAAILEHPDCSTSLNLAAIGLRRRGAGCGHPAQTLAIRILASCRWPRACFGMRGKSIDPRTGAPQDSMHAEQLTKMRPPNNFVTCWRNRSASECRLPAQLPFG